MKRLGVFAAAGFAALLMAGCGGQPDSSADAPAQPRSGSQAQQQKAAAGNEGNVFAPLEKDVEKARGVQKTVDQQAERLKKQIEKAEGAEDKDD
ncbi:MAG TPA: hypothetical protein VFY39_08565 [Gammaproteobacteria bacterium]|nr:hypothetical protein [Gammaproteobacteria bacterium]